MGVWLYLKQNSKKNIRILFSLLLLFYNLGWKPDEYIKQTLRLDSFFSTFFFFTTPNRQTRKRRNLYVSIEVVKAQKIKERKKKINAPLDGVFVLEGDTGLLPVCGYVCVVERRTRWRQTRNETSSYPRETSSALLALCQLNFPSFLEPIQKNEKEGKTCRHTRNGRINALSIANGSSVTLQ